MNIVIILFIAAAYIAAFVCSMAIMTEGLTSRRLWCAIGFSAFAGFFIALLAGNYMGLKVSEETAGRLAPVFIPAVILPIAAGLITGLVRKKSKEKKGKELSENTPPSASAASVPKPAVPKPMTSPVWKAGTSPARPDPKPAQMGDIPVPRTYNNPDRATHIRMAINDLSSMCASGSIARNSEWVRNVGQDLYDTHGFSAMQETYSGVTKRYPICGSLLSKIWNGVGDWAD